MTKRDAPRGGSESATKGWGFVGVVQSPYTRASTRGASLNILPVSSPHTDPSFSNVVLSQGGVISVDPRDESLADPSEHDADATGVRRTAVKTAYRATAVASYNAGRGYHYVSTSNDSAVRLCSQLEIEILSRSASFLSLDEHASAIAAKAPKEVPSSAIRETLQTLAASGLLDSEDQLRAELATKRHDPSPPDPIRTLVIVTCERPELFERCLRSYAENVRRFGRAVQFLVIDDSKTAELARATRDVARALREQLSINVRYIDREERARFAAKVRRACAKRGVTPELVDFALLGSPRFRNSVGATRNVSLLATLGQRFVTVDDDTVCELALAPGVGAGLGISSASPMDVRWYDNREAALSSVTFGEHDFVRLHEDVLGWHVWDRFGREEPKDLHLRQAKPELVRQLRTRGGRVRLTQMGIVGDSGIGEAAPLPHLLKSGEARAPLVTSEEAYRRATSSREIVQCTSMTTVSDDGSRFMIGAAGIDNRELLPPFFPVLRGEDAMFGMMVKKCDRTSLFAYAPEIVAHFPGGERSFDRSALAEGYWIDLTSIVDAIVIGVSSHPGFCDPARIMSQLGGALREVGALPRADFDEFAWNLLARAASGMIAHFDRLLSEHRGEPAYWARDLEAFIEGTHRSVRERPVKLGALSAGRDSELCGSDWELCRNTIGQFGELVRAWPEICAAASEIQDLERGFGVDPSSCI